MEFKKRKESEEMRKIVDLLEKTVYLLILVAMLSFFTGGCSDGGGGGGDGQPVVHVPAISEHMLVDFNDVFAAGSGSLADPYIIDLGETYMFWFCVVDVGHDPVSMTGVNCAPGGGNCVAFDLNFDPNDLTQNCTEAEWNGGDKDTCCYVTTYTAEAPLGVWYSQLVVIDSQGNSCFVDVFVDVI